MLTFENRAHGKIDFKDKRDKWLFDMLDAADMKTYDKFRIEYSSKNPAITYIRF